MAKCLKSLNGSVVRKYGSRPSKPLILLYGSTEVFAHTTYGAPLEAARPLRINRGAL